MRSLFDIRFSRSALALITLVSAAATFVILHGAPRRTPAQLAALAALRDRPHAGSATTAAVGTSAQPSDGAASAGGAGSGSRSFGGSGGGGSSGAGGSGLPGTAVPSSSAATPPRAPSSTQTRTQTTSSSSHGPANHSDLPKVRHVFEIVLSAPSYAAAFGHRSALTVLHSLIHKGTLLSDYRSLGEGPLADELAAVSGQAPNRDTERGCSSYVDFPTAAVADAAGNVPGRGCVYPETALTIGDQVSATGATWGAYVADMGSQTCVHPDSGAVDDVLPAGAQPGYDTRHNPFIYFHSLLDLGDCASDDVDLGRLPKALADPAKTPAFAYLAPDACADGDPVMAPSSPTTTTIPGATTPASGTTTVASTTTTTTTTTTGPGTGATTTAGTTTTPSTASAPAGCPAGSASSGLAAENAFLKTWVPRVLHSGAYRHHGVLVIAFTRSGTAPGHPVRSGALVISAGGRRHARVAAAESPYALLRLDEDALHLGALAHARLAKGLAAAVLGHRR